MQSALAALLLLAAPLTRQAELETVPPAVEDQPLDEPSFVLIHTNDTRGYLESCG